MGWRKMCEEYCGKVSWWLTDEFKGMKTSEIPNAKDFPCFNPNCEVRFNLALGYSVGGRSYCSIECLNHTEKMNHE